jgi:hypothetical protein
MPTMVCVLTVSRYTASAKEIYGDVKSTSKTTALHIHTNKTKMSQTKRIRSSVTIDGALIEVAEDFVLSGIKNT